MSYLSIKKEHKIGYITINRPPANALAKALLEDFEKAIEELEQDSEVKVIILHGEGKFFAAGADIKEFTQVNNEEEFARLSKNGQLLFERLEALTKPVIAAIHGAALGGGLELAMACHIRIATEEAKLGLPELNLGIIPGFAGTQRLTHIAGSAKAAEMMLSGEPITGREAKAVGLVNQVCAEGEHLETAVKLAEKIASKSAVNIRMIMELLSYSKGEDFRKGVEREAELFGESHGTHDSKEGITAFLEKRKPQFKDH
ncbi:enoyl-CoA hydratase [Thalassorhabdus alkalitolerans]|uniref:Enoyl-CoA hydratase n=1 Tax=Thalassorhabdus alkalitolerans TaxID=2282697 RepID=A0ABW0YMR2_9BACI